MGARGRSRGLAPPHRPRSAPLRPHRGCVRASALLSWLNPDKPIPPERHCDGGAFVGYASSQGLPAQRVYLADYGPQGGRGLAAGRKLNKGEKLLCVPESLLLTTDTALQGAQLGRRSPMHSCLQ